MIWLLSFRTRSDASIMRPHLNKLCRMVLAVIDKAPFIKNYDARLRAINPEKEKSLDTWPYNAQFPRFESKLDAEDASAVLDPLITELQEKHSRYSCMCDISVQVDFNRMSRVNAWHCLLMINNVRNLIRRYCKQYCNNQMSLAFIFDNVINNSVITSEEDNAQSVKLYKAIYKDGDNAYVRDMLKNVQNAQNDLYHVPLDMINEIERLVNNFNINILSRLRVTIECNSDDKAIDMHCPENFEVSILDVQFLAWCLYKWKESKKNDIKDYSIRIYIQGTLMMRNKMRWMKDHFDMIENIDEIHAIGTPFNILNRYILPNCFVNRIVMTNPMLNTVGGDHQKTQIFPNTWKNPSVDINAPGYDVT